MGNYSTCYLQHTGAVLLLSCCLMYSPLVFLLSEKCFSAAKEDSEHGTQWSLLQD